MRACSEGYATNRPRNCSSSARIPAPLSAAIVLAASAALSTSLLIADPEGISQDKLDDIITKAIDKAGPLGSGVGHVHAFDELEASVSHSIRENTRALE